MHIDVLVLRNAHLIHRTTVELTVLELNIIWLLAKSFTNGLIADALCLSVDTINHHITVLHKTTGAFGHGGLVGFGFINKFLKEKNGEIIKAWENNDVVAWEWRKRKKGEEK